MPTPLGTSIYELYLGNLARQQAAQQAADMQARDQAWGTIESEADRELKRRAKDQDTALGLIGEKNKALGILGRKQEGGGEGLAGQMAETNYVGGESVRQAALDDAERKRLLEEGRIQGRKDVTQMQVEGRENVAEIGAGAKRYNTDVRWGELDEGMKLAAPGELGVSKGTVNTGASWDRIAKQRADEARAKAAAARANKPSGSGGGKDYTLGTKSLTALLGVYKQASAQAAQAALNEDKQYSDEETAAFRKMAADKSAVAAWLAKEIPTVTSPIMFEAVKRAFAHRFEEEAEAIRGVNYEDAPSREQLLTPQVPPGEMVTRQPKGYPYVNADEISVQQTSPIPEDKMYLDPMIATVGGEPTSTVEELTPEQIAEVQRMLNGG